MNPEEPVLPPHPEHITPEFVRAFNGLPRQTARGVPGSGFAAAFEALAHHPDILEAEYRDVTPTDAPRLPASESSAEIGNLPAS